MRHNLKKARTEAGWTQQKVADELGITLRYYKDIEAGVKVGAVELWDRMEDMFNVHQRILREKRPDQEESREKRREDRQS